MTNVPTPDDRDPNKADRLIDAYLDQTLTDEQATTLRRWLLAGPENARHYARRAVMHQRLRERLHGEPMAQLSIELSEITPESNQGFWSLVDALDDHDHTASVRDVTEIYAAREKERRDRARSQSSRAKPDDQTNPRSIVIVIPKLVAIAALVGLVGLIGLVAYHLSPDRPAPQQAQQDEDIPPVAAEPVEVAQVAWSLDAVWSDRIQRSDEFRLLQGTYTLESGVVEITYDRGASSVIQGPATFELVDDNTSRLTSGRITARVPEEAKGFTVITPKARVVDFGTEFGVEVAENGATTAAVFTGVVELSADIPPTGAAGHPDESRSITLSKGWQSHVDENATLDNTAERVDPTRHFLLNRKDALYRPEIQGNGRYVRASPSSVAKGQFVDAERISVFLERASLALPSPIQKAVTKPGQYTGRSANLQEASIRAGQVCDSYLLHFDPAGKQAEVTITMTFPRPILGVITVGSVLYDTDAFCAKPEMGLPLRSDFEDGTGRGRGIDPDPTSQDALVLSDDRRTLTLTLEAHSVDQVRVLTEPSNNLLFVP